MNDQNRFLLYTAPNGAVKVEVFFKDETVWLTQKALAELFGVKVPAINKHLKNIFDSGELKREATVSKMEIVRGGVRQSRGHHLNPPKVIVACSLTTESTKVTKGGANR